MYIRRFVVALSKVRKMAKKSMLDSDRCIIASWPYTVQYKDKEVFFFSPNGLYWYKKKLYLT
jgi:hypothetical protein